MRPSVRTIGDNRQREFSDLTAVRPGGPSLARPEFLADADINSLLRRYGAVAPQRAVESGDVNTDVDLTTAFDMLRDAREAYAGADARVLERYPTFGSFVEAVEAGEDFSWYATNPSESADSPPSPADSPSDGGASNVA